MNSDPARSAGSVHQHSATRPGERINQGHLDAEAVKAAIELSWCHEDSEGTLVLIGPWSEGR